MTAATDGARPRIKNDPANYRTRASLASAPVRERTALPQGKDREHAFFTAPIDERGYIRFDKVPAKEAE